MIECHPKISYPNNVWYDIPNDDRAKITELHTQQRNQNSSNASVISEITTGTALMINGQQHMVMPVVPARQSQASQVGTQPSLAPAPSTASVPPPPLPPPRQVTFMGGRNEQSSLRSRNNNSGYSTGGWQ